MHAETNPTEDTAVAQLWPKMVEENQTKNWVVEEEDERVNKKQNIGMVELKPFKPLGTFVFMVVWIYGLLIVDRIYEPFCSCWTQF